MKGKQLVFYVIAPMKNKGTWPAFVEGHLSSVLLDYNNMEAIGASSIEFLSMGLDEQEYKYMDWDFEESYKKCLQNSKAKFSEHDYDVVDEHTTVFYEHTGEYDVVDGYTAIFYNHAGNYAGINETRKIILNDLMEKGFNVDKIKEEQ